MLKPSVLVIDDDRDLRELYAELLMDEGYEVHQATSADEGLSILNETSFIQLILLDLTLPGLRVDDFITEKNALQKSQNIPIVTVSGREDIAQYSELIGAVDFIPKPFNLDLLISKVKANLLPAI